MSWARGLSAIMSGMAKLFDIWPSGTIYSKGGTKIHVSSNGTTTAEYTPEDLERINKAWSQIEKDMDKVWADVDRAFEDMDKAFDELNKAFDELAKERKK